MFFYKVLYCIAIPILRMVYRVKITGRENIPEGAVVVCGNHTSLMDAFFVAMAFGRKEHMAYMAKIELFKVPVIGFLMRKIEAIPVDRGAADMLALKTAIAMLKSGKKVMIFPEGTRVDGDSASEDGAKTGAAMIACRGGADMLPIYISTKKRLFRRVNVIVGAPVKTDSFEGAGSAKYKKVIRHVFEEILRMGKEGENNA
ncbi:MAG: 1-acyl-sn-glycerol-3-phosphate acyltransferase [Oscillospiraceae bacterium]|nr:1-acyl-sn-glycerol-3-phosphate acyltransferase [Oscillospiraceae bacterium]MBQ7120334.1 1-acyl-sn-glycerol-3-phosphate acyltransferase [Oscillospiraceae bacterium]